MSRPGWRRRTRPPRRAARSSEMVEFCLTTSREEVRAQDGRRVSVITALAPLPHPRFSRFFAQIKQDLGFGVYVPDCDTTACAFSAATQAGSDRSDPRPAAAGFLCRLPGPRRRQRAQGDGAAQRQHRLRRRRRHLDRQSRGRTAVRQRPRSDAQSRHPRSQLPQSRRWKMLETPAAAGDGAAASSASRSGWRQAARSPIRARISIICRSFIAPISAAATRPSSRCRAAARQAIDPDGAFELIRTQGAGLCAGRADRRRDERVRRGAGADRARPSRRRCRDASRRRCIASSAISAKAAGTGRSGPMSGTR